MKTKKFSKKLSLNKATVADLNNSQMTAVQGGAPWTSLGILNKCYTLCDTGVCCPTIYRTDPQCCVVFETEDGCIPTAD